MSEKEKKKKPTYEAPAVIPLGELARGESCPTGTGAEGTCSANGQGATGNCSAFGDFAKTACQHGDYAFGVCGPAGNQAAGDQL